VGAERPTVRLGPFAVFARLGVGGMGEVFRARRADAVPDEPDVALKLIRGEHAADPHLRGLFLREAQIGALLHHPNVVELREVGEVDGIPYLAMEYVDGVSLDRLLDRPLSVAGAARVALSIAAALEYIHRLDDGGRPLRLIHRDVSPANVLIGRDGGVKLGDFGIAKLAGASLTRTNEVKGKRSYMAPEQLEGGAIDHRADLFSLGALLHRVAHGAPLFRDVEDWLAAGAPRPEEGVLAPVVARACEPEAAARFESAAEMAAALRRAVAEPGPEATAELASRAADRMSDRPALGDLDQVILAELASELGDTARVEPPVAAAAAPPPPPRRGRRGWIAAGAAGAIAVAATAIAVAWPSDERAAPVAAVAPPEPAPPASATDAGGDAAPPSHRPRRRREEPGFLTLDTTPWATVYLAGRKVGTTPFHRVKLPAGRHRLALDIEDSGRRRSLTVVIRPGSEVRRSVDLR
jgi:hypothetical protein